MRQVFLSCLKIKKLRQKWLPQSWNSNPHLFYNKSHEFFPYSMLILGFTELFSSTVSSTVSHPLVLPGSISGVNVEWLTMWTLSFQSFLESLWSPWTRPHSEGCRIFLQASAVLVEPTGARLALGSWEEQSCQQESLRAETQEEHASQPELSPMDLSPGCRGTWQVVWGLSVIWGCDCGLQQRRMAALGPCSEAPVLGGDTGEL